MPEHAPEIPAAVLVVEDDEALSTMLEFAFRRWGVTAHFAANGAKAIEVCRQRGAEIGLVLMEAVLPDMDGPTTLGSLRAIRPDLKFWFMGGTGGTYTQPELLASGAEGLLPKPFDLKALRAILGPTAGPMRGVERRTSRAEKTPWPRRHERRGLDRSRRS
jgi:DNA-binding response OmpR family regulator